LANPYEQLRRSTSFAEGGVTDEEFFRFFEQIGEVVSPVVVANRTPRRNTTRSRKSSPKKSPREAAGKSPAAKATKSPAAKATRSPREAAGKPPGET